MARFVYFVEILGKTGNWYSPRVKELKGFFESFNECDSRVFQCHRKNKKCVIRVVRADMSPTVNGFDMFKVMITYGTLSKK